MRGNPDPQLAMLISLSTEELIPVDHPIRADRVVVDAVLAELDPIFDEMYATGDRRSVPSEQLLKATVLMAMYSIRSERAFCERLNDDLLFKWFLDMRLDQVHAARRADTKHSAIDGRTTRHTGHQVSQRIRKRVEQPFGWAKTIGGGRQLRNRGRQRNRAWFKMTAPVYNLIRIIALDTQQATA